MSYSYTPYSDVYSSRDYGRDDRRPSSRAQDAGMEEVVRENQQSNWYAPAVRRDDMRDSYRARDDLQYEYARRRERRARQQRNSFSSSDSDDDRIDRRQRAFSRSRRTQSERPTGDTARQEQYDGDLSRVAGRTFDKSENGIFVGALGAAIGAITVRRFGINHFDGSSNKNDHWKTLGGAVAGGLAANAAEQQWRKRRAKGRLENAGNEA